MMKNAADTLFYTIQNDSLLNGGGQCLFLNAQFHDDLLGFEKHTITLQQHFKPYADILSKAGLEVSYDFPGAVCSYDAVFILIPKNIIEAQYMIAKGLGYLREGGVLVCAADNKAGGSRLKKMMQSFGFQDVEQESRNKARAVWAVKQSPDEAAMSRAIKAGEAQPVLKDIFISKPGVFGWDKIDTGSKILTEYLPKDIVGVGADFGCGYGYLSHYLLSEYTDISRLLCVDADHRALSVVQENLRKFDYDKHFLWSDLTISQTGISDLDFIVMNPPFHEGKKTDSDIGVSFIDGAHASLKKQGRLFMVANQKLPYEDVLRKKFTRSEKLYEGQGFKVYTAIK